MKLRKKQKDTLRQMKIKIQQPKICGRAKQVFNLKQLGKEQTKLKVSRRKNEIKIRAEINKRD